jgi:prepilin-type N-terminal cleavage/methylation domain-containing protein
MLHNRNKLSSFFGFRSGFTLVELLLAVVALPVVLVGIVFLNAYVPSLILRSLGYEIDFWFYFAVNVVAGVIGYGYTLLGASRTASKDAPASKRLAKASLAYLLHSVLLMLIFAETGNDIGFLHLLLAGLTMPILWQLTLLAVRRYRSGRSSGTAEKSTLN